MLKTIVQGERRPDQNRTDAGTAKYVGAVCDQHGAALLSLAMAVGHDRQRAEAAVVEVIRTACRSAAPEQRSADGVRRELARRLYLYCAPRRSGRTVQDQERIALALTQWGRLTYRAAAVLLGLPAAEVADLLTSAVRKIADLRLGS